jgi:protocatechuate 3,4-dioxygenase beta subunit
MSKPDPIGRRSALASLIRAGGTMLFIPAWNETVEAADALICIAGTTPTTTEGPYWVDAKLFRSDIRTDPSTGTAREGVPLTLTIQVQNLTSSGSCSALTGAYVDIWHCDAKGIYSDEPTYNPGGGTGNVNTTGQQFLRGYQITNENGSVTFTSIFPGWYTGRTIHVHLRVRTYSGTTVLSNFVTQIFFDEAVNNAVLALPAYSRTTSRDTTNATDNILMSPIIRGCLRR